MSVWLECGEETGRKAECRWPRALRGHLDLSRGAIVSHVQKSSSRFAFQEEPAHRSVRGMLEGDKWRDVGGQRLELMVALGGGRCLAVRRLEILFWLCLQLWAS